MNWKRWKMGLFVSCLTGLFAGVTGLAIGITWEQFGILLGVNIAKDALLYLKEHPVDTITDTITITQTTTTDTAKEKT